jgi:1-acyl-sn-glycerol-3-phosphate acyltransferase
MTWLRSAVFNAWFYGLTVVMALGSLPVRAFAPRRVPTYARSWARLVLGGLRPLCGITWEVSGAEHLPATGPALIASMHQSAFDTLIWAVLEPRFAYVLKRELLAIPLVGEMLRRTGMIAIDRSGGAAAVRALLRDADRAVAEQRRIVIFPEGTRVAPGVRAPLLPGVAALAARTRLPVIPVATDSGRHWARRAFRKQPGVIHIAIQPPIEPGLSRDALLARLEAAFAIGFARISQSVDKPVGESGADLPSRPREAENAAGRS